MFRERSAISNLFRQAAMGDIKDSRLLWMKFILFIITGCLAAIGALVLLPSLQLAVLLVIAIWSFCRAYYFAFYVIERYIDPSFRFAGLASLIRYAIRNRVFTRKVT
jgi:hypothetical protein